jgi:hypothetical protein
LECAAHIDAKGINAKTAFNMLEWNASIPSETIILKIEQEWAYQKGFAQRTVEYINGEKKSVIIFN